MVDREPSLLPGVAFRATGSLPATTLSLEADGTTGSARGESAGFWWIRADRVWFESLLRRFSHIGRQSALRVGFASHGRKQVLVALSLANQFIMR